MYVIVWRYEVAARHEAVFRAAYGADGEWARLFAQAPGFVSTALYRDDAAPGTFLTLDTWSDESAFAAFQSARGGDYAALDAKLAHLSVQTRLGAFSV